MSRESHVIVGADHDELSAVDVNLGSFGMFDRDEIGKNPHGLGGPGIQGIAVFLGHLGVGIKAFTFFE
jgi:hypothetical protein